MYLFLYTIYRIISCLKNHKSFFKEENPYLCFKYYFDDKESDKKSLLRVIREVNHLCKYWHHFPETYFWFCHYQKEYDNMQQLKSFLPQGSYENFCKGGLDSSSYKIVVSDKIIFHELMEHYGLPVPHMLFYYRNNLFYADGKIVEDEIINRIIGNCHEERIFMKLSCSGQGKGVYIAKRSSGNSFNVNGEKLDASYIRQRFCNQSVFFEKQLEQESVLKSFNPDTINTIRVLTKNYKGKVAIVSASVRFGRQGGFVDNMCAGGLGVSLNVKTGCLEKYGGRLFDSRKYYDHPDSQLSFNGVRIPQWDNIMNLVYKTISFLPQYRSLGFDIVTTPNGPVIIEINIGAGMGIAQVGKEYGIADYFDYNLTRNF